MATKFPKFSQALAQDPATRRIWYGIATAHDLEAHDGMTEENLYQKIFASHFGHLAVIFLWTSGNLFHVAQMLIQAQGYKIKENTCTKTRKVKILN